ncbi:MAG TPA: hypothetical protein VHZ81_10795 [Galbitalea sp.]|nr:hypothetical protein [Galbitalea sp.]
MIKGAEAVAAIAVVLALAGCAPAVSPPSHTHAAAPTPAPSPSPTAPPTLSELTLSPDGLGVLVIGSPVPKQSSSAAVVVWNPTQCDATSGAWLANYPSGPTIYGAGAPFVFDVNSKDEPLPYITILSPQIKTAAGISLGSTRDEVVAAYPRARVVSAEISDLYVVDGTAGELVIEIPKTSFDAGADANHVVDLYVALKSYPPGPTYQNDAGGRLCPGGS